jgi:hypothetical protein
VSPVGVTPLAATMNDLAAVYLTNRNSLEALLTQVEVDINGVAVAAVPTPELATPAIASTTVSAGGDNFVSVGTPFAGDGATAGEATYELGGARTLTPYGGLMGDTLAAGADAVGSPAVAQRLAPAGVQFGADGQAFRVVDASLSEPPPVNGPGAALPTGAAQAAATSGTPASGAGGAAAVTPVAGRTGSHGRHSARLADAGPQRGSLRHVALDPPVEGASAPPVPTTPELPPLPHAGVTSVPVHPAEAVPTAFGDGGAVSGSNPGINGMAAAAGTEPGAAAAAAPWMAGLGVGAGYEADGGGRLPPWLHESEDVWGEEVVVTSPVIGEVDQPNPLRAPRLL